MRRRILAVSYAVTITYLNFISQPQRLDVARVCVYIVSVYAKHTRTHSAPLMWAADRRRTRSTVRSVCFRIRGDYVERTARGGRKKSQRIGFTTSDLTTALNVNRTNIQ